jgi:hypothetical protein
VAFNPKRGGSKVFDGELNLRKAKTAGPSMTNQDLLGQNNLEVNSDKDIYKTSGGKKARR